MISSCPGHFLRIQKMPVITSFTNHSIEIKINNGVYEIKSIIPCLKMSELASEKSNGLTAN